MLTQDKCKDLKMRITNAKAVLLVKGHAIHELRASTLLEVIMGQATIIPHQLQVVVPAEDHPQLARRSMK